MLPRRGVVAGAAISAAEIMTVLVAAHTWAGGALPSMAWLALTAALVFAVGTVVLRHRVPPAVTVAALTAAQLLLHGWLVVLAPAPSGAHPHGPHLELTWQMLLAHVVGALAGALVWELRRRAVDVVLSWADAGLLPAPAPRRTAARHAPWVPLRRPLVVVPLRGPPAGAVS